MPTPIAPLPPRVDIEAGDRLPSTFTLGVWDTLTALNSTDPASGSSMIGLDSTSLPASGDNVQSILEALYRQGEIKSDIFSATAISRDFADSDVSASTLVDVYLQEEAQGIWTITSSATGFNITSTKSETSDVNFKYIISR